MTYNLDLKRDDWELVGYQAVDSGTVIISDPCYVLPDERDVEGGDKPYDKTYGDFLAVSNNSDTEFQPWGDGTATILSTTYGDGSYPIYIQRDQYGRPTTIVIDLAQELGGVYEYTDEEMREDGILGECPNCGADLWEWEECDCEEDDEE